MLALRHMMLMPPCFAMSSAYRASLGTWARRGDLSPILTSVAAASHHSRLASSRWHLAKYFKAPQAFGWFVWPPIGVDTVSFVP